MKPVFVDEVIGQVGGAYTPVYDITAGNVTIASDAEIKLKNPITQQGTPHSAAVMNLLFDFDNIAGMPGNKRVTAFNADGSVTETIASSTAGTDLAKRVTTFPGNTVVGEETLYDSTGTALLRQTVTTTTFNTDGTISEEVI